MKNVESLEYEFSKSKFSNLTSFHERIENLKKLAIETQIKHKVAIDESKSCISCCFNENFKEILKSIGTDMNRASKTQKFDEKLQNIEEIFKVSVSMFNKSLENASDLENLKEAMNIVVLKMDKIEKKLDRILALIKTED
jgi:soluble cytochrome b562